MPTSVGPLDPPLGNARLQVSKLITALVATNMAPVNIELVNLNTLQAILVSPTLSSFVTVRPHVFEDCDNRVFC